MADADAAADVTVTCRQGDLASLLMGSCQLEGMLRLGAASADNGVDPARREPGECHEGKQGEVDLARHSQTSLGGADLGQDLGDR